MKIDRSLLLYAAATAAFVAFFIWFAGLLTQRVNSLTWGILLSGLAGSAALVIFVFVRWIINQRAQVIGQAAVGSLAEAEKIFSGDPSAVVTQDQVRQALLQMGSLKGEALELGKLILSVLFVMGITMQVVVLATAAVGYLQAERLGQQNQLFDSQNTLQRAQLILDNAAATGQLVETIQSARSNQEIIREDLLDAARSAESLYETVFPVTPCGSDPEECKGVGMNDFAEAAQTSILIVREENAEAWRGYADLEEVFTLLFITLTSPFGNAGTDPGTDLQEATSRIETAQAACGVTPGHLNDLWLSITALSFAAIEMFPFDRASIDEQNEWRLSSVQDRANFLGYAAAIGSISEDLAKDPDSIQSSAQLYDLTLEGLDGLAGELEILAQACDDTASSLERAVNALKTEQVEAIETLRLRREELRIAE